MIKVAKTSLTSLSLRGIDKISLPQRKIIDTFVNSFKFNNFKRQSELLAKVVSTNNKTVQLQCINLYLHHFLKNEALININDLKSFIEKFKLLEFDDVEILNKLTYCLVHAYKNVRVNKVLQVSLNNYIANTLLEISKKNVKLDLAESLSTTVNEILNYSGNLTSRNKLKKVFRTSVNTPLSLDIDRYKTNGTITFKQLLDYISVPFLTTDVPLYEYYEQLDADAKETFMTEYLEFNRIKQYQIELNCVNLAIDWNAFGAIKSFTTNFQPLSHNWLQLARKYQQLKASNATLSKYQSYLDLMESQDLANLVLGHSLSSLLESSKGQLLVVSVLSKLVHQFKRIMFTKLKAPIPIHDDALYKIFSVLVEVMIEHCQVEVPKDFIHDPESDMTKVFTHKILKYMKKSLNSYKTPGVIQLNPFIFQLFMFKAVLGSSGIFYLPMLSPPKPYVSPNEGGYLNNIQPMILNINLKLYSRFLQQASKTGQLDGIYSNLNYISSIPWCFNQKVISVINHLVDDNDGVQTLGIPPIDLKVSHDTSHDQKRIHRQMSKRMKYDLFKLITKSFKDNIMYFPHGVDFRSRIYPLVSGMSYLDEDMIRSAYQFWKAEPFGENGFTWFKYQLAGLYGLDKLSLEPRLKFVDENMPRILQCAKDPINETWWHTAESPWQFLAHCFEMLAISESTVPIEEFKTRLAIHQDGSCNGLQHYSALAGDIEGAKTVNVLPNDERQDIYSDVVKIVADKLTDDLQDLVIAKILSRKLVKRPIMTQVYGVTVYGAARQMIDMIPDLRLEALCTPEELKYFEDNKFMIMKRIASLIFDSIQQLFFHSKSIQQWLLANCFRVLVVLDENAVSLDESTKPMMWTSITGFPVIQLYTKPKLVSLKTQMQAVTIARDDEYSTMDLRKQLNAVAPNFIHSLDASHLYLTSEQCRVNNIPFVSVHDSFWTTPAKVDDLNKIIRQQFVQLHSSNILERLYTEMSNNIKHCYHLVWFKQGDYPELLQAVKLIRNNSEGNRESVLLKELKDNTILQQFQHLIETHNPKLYMQRNNAMIPYEGIGKSFNRTKDKYIPVFTRASLLKPPGKGDLDITKVMESKFFFS